MTDPLVLELEALREEVSQIRMRIPSVRTLSVTDTDPQTRTFTVAVPGAEPLPDLWGGDHFLPAVGDEVEIELFGATPVLRPLRIGAGAIGEDELAPPVTQRIDVALETASGKNQVTFSEDPPPASGYAGTAGDLWFQRDIYGLGNIVGTWEWTGGAWSSRAFHDNVLNSLTVGKLVGGTGVFDMLFTGSMYSADSGPRWKLDGAGLQFYGDSSDPVFDLDVVNKTATFRGTVEGALIRTSSAGQRLEIQSGGEAGGRTLTFYPAGAGQPALFLSRDDSAGNAGINMEAGGANHGYINFNSSFADIGYRYGQQAGSWVNVNDSSLYTVALASLRSMSFSLPGKADFFNGTDMFARISAADGMERLHRFSLSGRGGSFTFGIDPGGTDADVYALRFISTNPGGTGGFIYFSDRRLKRNVRPVKFDALAEVLAMPVQEFEWAETGETGFGFQAQEMPVDVQVRLSPDEPVGGVTDPIGIASELLLAKVVKAVQQLDAKVEAALVKGAGR